MKTMRLGACALAVVLAGVAATATDAPGVPAAAESLRRFSLLRQESVQKELQLSDEQSGKVKALADKITSQLREIMRLRGDDRQKRLDELGREIDQFLKASLKVEQVKRLNEIFLQMIGLLAALENNQIADQFKLTDDQKSRARDLTREYDRETREMMTKMSGDKEEMSKVFRQVRAMREAADKKFQDALTAEQRTKWKELTGKPFEGRIEGPPPFLPRRGGNKKQ